MEDTDKSNIPRLIKPNRPEIVKARALTALPVLLPEETVDDRRRDHFSWSQMSTYQTCPEKYRLRYIQKLPDPRSLPSALGTAVHAALEANAIKKIATEQDMLMADLQDFTSDSVDNEFLDLSDSDVVKGNKKDEAIAEVTLFRRRDAEAIIPIAAEYRFSVNIEPNEQYPEPLKPVIGYIDTMEVTPRTVDVPGSTPVMTTVKDYKVVGQKRSQGEVDTTGQLTLYDMVIYQKTGKLVDSVGLRQFGYRQKEGPYSEVTMLSPEYASPSVRLRRFERLQQTIRAVQDAIRKGVFYPTDNYKNCSWCPYRQMCQFSLAKDISDIPVVE